MDWSSTPSLGVIKKSLDWLGQRQQVLACNVANADTPGYVPRDLEPFRFSEILRRQTTSVGVAVTDPGHIAGIRAGGRRVCRAQAAGRGQAMPR